MQFVLCPPMRRCRDLSLRARSDYGAAEGEQDAALSEVSGSGSLQGFKGHRAPLPSPCATQSSAHQCALLSGSTGRYADILCGFGYRGKASENRTQLRAVPSHLLLSDVGCLLLAQEAIQKPRRELLMVGLNQGMRVCEIAAQLDHRRLRAAMNQPCPVVF